MAKVMNFKGIEFYADSIVIRKDGTYFRVKQKPSFHSVVINKLSEMFIEKGFSEEVSRNKAEELFNELNPETK